MTKIMECKCQNEQQDKIHGKGKRVFNRTEKQPTGKVWRCTSCNNEKQIGDK